MAEEKVQTNQNVDDVLQSVSDKIIAKRKLKRTIISSVLLSIVVVLASIVLILAGIKVDMQPNFIGKADAYSVYISGVNKQYFDTDSKSYDKFHEELDKNFETNYLTALFSGKLDCYTIEETKTQFYADEARTSPSSALRSELGSNYVRFVYNEEQQVTNRDGSQYYSTQYKANTYALKFKDCYMKLDPSIDGQLTFYLGTYDYSKPMITKVIVKTSSAALYEYFSPSSN